MKYPGGNTSTLFCEQVGTVTSLFEQWNDCERTVVLYALLKRVPYANLKFLQLSIEYNIAQNYNSQSKLQMLENNSNNAVFLTKLINTYKNFKCNEPQIQKESVIYETSAANGIKKSNSLIYLDNFGKYDKKEDVLNDILTYLPLLKPGNDDAKAVFLSLIPCAVDDSVRQLIPMELVQQILSYLLIHPAISNDDRRSLSQWLRHLEDHMSLSYVPNKAPNYFLIPPNESSSTSSSVSTPWQAVAPPIQQTKISNDNTATPWDLKNIQVTQDFCDEVDFRKTIGKNIEFSQAVISNGSSHAPKQTPILYDNVNEDHHVSFSKNGTEILDYDSEDYNKSNTQIAFDPATHVQEFLTVPNFHENNVMKTRRSNSLTTTTTTTPPNVCTSSSSENLANILQKPRSFSLSMESPRSSLTSSGSETRLDEYKPNFINFNTFSIGMGNIGQWLKSLRLHKYIWLFSNITYEQMLDINETYLEREGVTKGARNKLVLCIQKLKDRSKILAQYIKDILSSQVSLNGILDDLVNMVITPMKPVDQYNTDDVAGLLLQIIDIVAKILITKPIVNQSDEDCITIFMTILERSLYSEGFIAASNTNLLKEHIFKISKIKLQFTPKSHYNKSSNNNGNGINKPRWNPNGPKQHKPNEKSQRKNSNFSINLQQQSHLQQYHESNCNSKFYTNNSSSNNKNSNNNNTNNLSSVNNCNNYNKSSSYPNFNSSLSNNNNNNSKNNKNSISSALSSTSIHQTNASNNYHRHSLNNLISTSSTIVSSNNNNKINNQNNNLISNSNSNNNSSNKNLNSNKENRNHKDGIYNNNNNSDSNSKHLLQKSSIGDINSRLESLCLQMTEQAIN